jgi:hypothetical protein
MILLSLRRKQKSNTFNNLRLWSTILLNSVHFSDLGLRDEHPPSSRTLNNYCRWFSGEMKNDCHSYWRHGICMMSIYDLLFLAGRPEYFAKKNNA